MAADDKKLFIDEDWKAQVQREREKALEEARAKQADEAPAAAVPGEDAEDGEESLFLALVGSLTTQAMLMLGLIAPQGQKQVMVDLDQSKYLIDTLRTLRDKTRGNLTAEEDQQLAEAVAELERLFVMREQQVQQAALKQAGVDLDNPRDPKLPGGPAGLGGLGDPFR